MCRQLSCRNDVLMLRDYQVITLHQNQVLALRVFQGPALRASLAARGLCLSKPGRKSRCVRTAVTRRRILGSGGVNQSSKTNLKSMT